MEKDRREKFLAVTALVVAVICLSVAFAAMSTTLKINGEAGLQTSSWKIRLENLSKPKIEGDAKELKTPSLSDLSIDNISILLKNPGDSITYDFDIVNAGTTDAISDGSKLNGYDYKNYENLTDSEKLTFLKTLFTSCDIDGDGITTDEEYKKGLEFINFELSYDEKGTELNANMVRRGSIKIYFDEASPELPKGVVSAKFTWELKYLQK